MKIFTRKLYLVCFILLAFPIILILSCQHRLIYFPRSYPEGFAHRWEAQHTGSKLLVYQTTQGQQTAFLIMPRTGEKPKHLWLVCCGNGTLAAERTKWIEDGAPKNDAYLLLDYPGYGDCHGSPTPHSIRENIVTAMPIAANHCSMTVDDLTSRGRFLGHSLGCATALIGACEFSLPQGLLIAPFTSTMDMADKMLGLPVGWLVTHRFDNHARIQQWLAQNGEKIHIFHSDNDPVIPLHMGLALTAINTNRISITTVQQGGHDDLIQLKIEEMHKIMHQ